MTTRVAVSYSTLVRGQNVGESPVLINYIVTVCAALLNGLAVMLVTLVIFILNYANVNSLGEHIEG